jgi:DNA-binding LytR/AlgR family response regulator
MKIFMYHKYDIEENRVDLYYNKIDQETENIIEFLDSFNKTLTGRNEEESKLINPNEIYYCEIVERKCFAYLKESVWQLDISLQMLLDKYCDLGFVRISKSMIVNIYKIDRLKSDISMRVNILLVNKETVILNRTYRNHFYKYLENMKREVR